MLTRARGGVFVALAGELQAYAGLATAAAAASAQHTAARDGPAAGSSDRLPAAPVSSSASQPGGTSYRPVVTGSVLKRHGRDLSLEAAEGRLDPLIGRHDVLERALQILLRRTKNNPVLIGDPGVGKTAVAEGIAQLIVSPAAPPGLAGRALVSLDVGSLVAGTQYRGAFEERLTSLLNEVRMAAGRVLLFIDELHILMDAGRVEGGINAANLLKPALARGDLHCIGATTVEEYRKHIEADGAFARRLQPVMVEEPTPEEALGWLKGLQPRYERFHGVRFTDAALEAAVQSAQRYIPDRRLPDSAIDAIDEAAARARLRAAASLRAASLAPPAAAALAVGMLPAADVQSAGLEQADGEHARQLAEWLSAAQQQQVQQAQQGGLSGFPAPSSAATAVPGAAGLGASAVHALSCPHCGTPASPPEGSGTVTCARCRFTYLSVPQEKLLLGASLFPATLQQQQQPQQAQQTQQRHAFGQPAAAAALAATAGPTAPAATAGLAALGAAAPPSAVSAIMPAGPSGPSAPPLVGAADVLAVVAEASGIPAQHLSQTDWQPLADLEARLRQRVAGQDSAVAAAVGAVRLGRLGLQRGSRPLASLLLTGPGGVGKATLCHALAEALFGSERHLLRFNLAEFSDRASVSRLIGAPPGYVGYGDGGLLTEAVRRRPHSVVLLEGVDRAHPEVLTLVTQILEAGQLQDSMGKRCDFRNAVLVLTTSPTSQPLPAGLAGSPAAAAAEGEPASASAAAEGEPASAAAAGSAKEQPWQHHQERQQERQQGGQGGGTTVVEVAESHVHADAYAGDSGAGHSAHSAAAQCLEPEGEAAGGGAEEPSSSSGGSGGSSRRHQQQPAGAAQPAQPVHPLRRLPAELLARLDAAVSMQPLGPADMERVVELRLEEVTTSLLQSGIQLSVEPTARSWLAARGLSPASGARRLQPLLREQVLLPMAEALLAQRLLRQQRQAEVGTAAGEAMKGSQLAAVVRVAADGLRLEVGLA